MKTGVEWPKGLGLQCSALGVLSPCSEEVNSARKYLCKHHVVAVIKWHVCVKYYSDAVIVNVQFTEYRKY